VSDFEQCAIGCDAVDGPVFEFSFFVSDVARVGEVDSASRVDAEVVWRVESFARVAVGERSLLTVLGVGT
jgi:hypothetical protein